MKIASIIGARLKFVKHVLLSTEIRKNNIISNRKIFKLCGKIVIKKIRHQFKRIKHNMYRILIQFLTYMKDSYEGVSSSKLMFTKKVDDTHIQYIHSCDLYTDSRIIVSEGVCVK